MPAAFWLRDMACSWAPLSGSVGCSRGWHVALLLSASGGPRAPSERQAPAVWTPPTSPTALPLPAAHWTWVQTSSCLLDVHQILPHHTHPCFDRFKNIYASHPRTRQLMAHRLQVVELFLKASIIQILQVRECPTRPCARTRGRETALTTERT